MDLKELLGEELYAQVSEKLGDKKLIEDDGKMIPHTRFNEVNDAKKIYKEQADSLTTDLTNLQEKLKGFEGLEGLDKTKFEDMQTQLTTLQEQLVGKDKEVNNISKSSLIKDALSKAQLKKDYEAIIMSQFNLDDYEVKDGIIEGLDDKIATMQTSYKDMFGANVIQGANLENGNGDTATITKDEYKAMGYNERVKLSNENPKLYETLTQK